MRQYIVYALEWLLERVQVSPHPDLCLTYFDGPGIAECIRWVFNYRDIKYVDERLTVDEFEERKVDLPFGQLPVLCVDDGEYAQSKAILRYAGKITHHYPSKNCVAALAIDEWVELHTEFMNGVSVVKYPERYGLTLSKNQTQVQQKWMREVHMPKYMRFLENELRRCEWLADMNAPSIADFCWMPTLEWIISGDDGVVLAEFPWVTRYIFDHNSELGGSLQHSASELATVDEETVDSDQYRALLLLRRALLLR